MPGQLTVSQRMDRMRLILAAAGQDGVEIKETTPKYDGVRAIDVELLISSGEAEWVIPYTIARLKPIG